MSRPAPTTLRTILVLLAAASILGWLPRLRRTGSIRAHVELLQNLTPIHQFAPAGAVTAFTDLDRPFRVKIVAHRLRDDLPYSLVPIDDRAVAAWLA